MYYIVGEGHCPSQSLLLKEKPFGRFVNRPYKIRCLCEPVRVLIAMIGYFYI